MRNTKLRAGARDTGPSFCWHCCKLLTVNREGTARVFDVVRTKEDAREVRVHRMCASYAVEEGHTFVGHGG